MQPRRRTPIPRAAAVPALLLACWATSTPAADSSDPLACRRAVGAASAKYFKRTAAALAQCADRVAAGRLAAGTDCSSEPKVAGRAAKAATMLEKKITPRCADAVVAGLRFGSGCDASTAAQLVSCLRAGHDRAVGMLHETLYADDGQLARPSRRCRARASRLARRLVAGRLRALRQCKNDADAGELPAGALCSEKLDATGAMAKPRRRAATRIAKACDATVLTTLPFGAPCEQLTDGPALAACLLARGDAAADAASTTAYGDGAFCGDAHQAVEARVDALLGRLTLEEKAAQMHGLGLPTDGAWRTSAVPALGIPGFAMLDGPRGVSVVAGNATAFPVAIARGATWDVDLEARIGEAIGREARAKGASVLLAPVTTVIRHPRWGRSQETYGEDPDHIGEMGVAFVRGAQRHVIASVKHYAVNSIEDTRFRVDVTVDERTLREIYLPHFRRVVRDGHAASVMSAYNSVNGAYCAENAHLLRDVLKQDWGFRGFVESDWFFGTHDTVASMLAGLDVEMPTPQIYGPALIDAVNTGAVPESLVDDAVRRILRTQLCFRLDSEPPTPDAAQVETPDHVALALEAARKGIVLLENDAGILPLARTAVTEIAVTGPLADVENIGDHGSSDVAPTDVVTVLEGLVDRAGGVTITHVPDPSTPVGQAAVAAADAVIVVVGFTVADEGEGLIGAGDRETYALPPVQEQLITDVAALGTKTIVVLEGGSAIGVEAWVDAVDALLMAWYPGQQGGNAVADVLFGDVNPSGKLPLVVAARESDLPPFVNDQDAVTYDYYHGYRLLDRNAVTPRYPFGYGLSYTRYAYSNLVVADPTPPADGTLRVHFDVTNTGDVDGEEIAQLYVSYHDSAVDRPLRELEGFARVPIAAGQTRTVTLEVPVDDLAYYDVARPGWVVEPITYGVHVGPSAGDLPLAGSITVAP